MGEGNESRKAEREGGMAVLMEGQGRDAKRRAGRGRDLWSLLLGAGAVVGCNRECGTLAMSSARGRAQISWRAVVGAHVSKYYVIRCVVEYIVQR